MRLKLKNMFAPLTISLILLLIFEILISTLFPIFGLSHYRLQFHIILVLFLGFKLETPWHSILILIIEYTHSFFSNEGWAIGTFVGTLICFFVSYIRDMIQFNSVLSTILITQFFQLLWTGIISAVIYIQSENITYITERFWHFIPESLVISLLSPFFYGLFEKIWSVDGEAHLSEGLR